MWNRGSKVKQVWPCVTEGSSESVIGSKRIQALSKGPRVSSGIFFRPSPWRARIRSLVTHSFTGGSCPNDTSSLQPRNVPARPVAILCLALLLAAAVSTSIIFPASAANNQDVSLYLHRLPGNVTVSGVTTREIINATTQWNGQSLTSNLRYARYNFTLYPALALNLQSTGTALLDLWITVTGAPGSLNATLFELNALGEEAVVTSSVNVANSTDPQTPYRIILSLALNRAFSASSTLKVELRASRISQLFVYYDSPSYASRLTLPTSGVPQVSRIDTFDWSLVSATSFSLNWTASQRTVYAVVHVSDPFGAYHVKNATFTILDPSSQTVSSGSASVLSTSPGFPEELFGLTLAYDSNYQTGNYTVSVRAFDWSENQALGSSQFRIYSTSQPPGQQPPSNPPTNPPSFPFELILIPLALIAAGLLLGFLLYSRVRHDRCTKCGARIKKSMDKCPACGQPV